MTQVKLKMRVYLYHIILPTTGKYMKVNRKPRTKYADTVIIGIHGSKHRGVIIEGVTYETTKQAAAAYGVSLMAISHWINGQVKGGIFYPPFDGCQPVFHSNKHKLAWRKRISTQIAKFDPPRGWPPAVVIDGFIYASTRDAATELDVSEETIRNWCRKDTFSTCWYESKRVYENRAA